MNYVQWQGMESSTQHFGVEDSNSHMAIRYWLVTMIQIVYEYRWYCWWLKSCTSCYGSLSHYLQGFIHSRWCRISSVNSSTGNARNAALLICPTHFSMVWTTKHRTTASVSIVRLPLQTLRWFRVFEWVHLGCNAVWDMFMKGSFPSNHIKQNITLKKWCFPEN